MILTDHDGRLDDQGHTIPGQLSPYQDAGISLPASLFTKINSSKMTNIGMFFGFYENATLFPVGEQSASGREMVQTQVCSRVLAATLGQNINIRNLKPEESVIVTFRLSNKTNIVSGGHHKIS